MKHFIEKREYFILMLTTSGLLAMKHVHTQKEPRLEHRWTNIIYRVQEYRIKYEVRMEVEECGVAAVLCPYC